MAAENERQKELLAELDPNRIPSHAAVIMDGNGRWAQQRGLPRIAGHQSGMETVRRIVEAAGDAGLDYLTLYAFSTENWVRPQDEIAGLMALLKEYLQKEVQTLDENGIKLRTIGRTDEFPPEVQEELQKAIATLEHNTKHTLILALNYGSRREITEAAGRIARDVASGSLDPESLDEKTFARYLYTAEYPDPDLMIRTSGELRISNYLLWQLAYAEFYVTPTLWPDFTKEEFYEALIAFQKRERRMGGVKAVR